MKNLYPSAMADRVYRITPQLLKSWGVRGLILDIDNTSLPMTTLFPTRGWPIGLRKTAGKASR